MLLAALVLASAGALANSSPPADLPGCRVISLDGAGWQLAHDPANAGRRDNWWQQPRPDAKQTRVPWIAQDAFPGQHGVFWYWRDFTAPAALPPQGRAFLRFWAVDYKAEVWLNGTRIGEHEGGETPFSLDVTAALRPGAANRLAVRVVNPTHQPIDGLVLNETPHRNKALPYTAGNAWDQGGIVDSVELRLVSPVRLDDLFVRPDPRTGLVRLRARVHNAAPAAATGELDFRLAPAAGGELAAAGRIARPFPPGDTTVEAELRVEHPRLWELNDPFLYRVTARLRADSPASDDELSVRCGFRDFRFADRAFRLNGRRLFLKCSHTGNCCPVGLEMPLDPDWLRRDLLNSKVLGFNAVRFIAGIAKRYQLDLCDDIGLLVYEESYAGWCLADSPKMPACYDESVLGMVRRDRNHPSVAIWGLLNETPDGPVFRHAAGILPALRAEDDTRLVMLNSGRWDRPAGGLAGLAAWRDAEREDPCVTHNGTRRTLKGLGITWAPGQLALHPGRNGEYAAVRWTAPADDRVDVAAVFASIAEAATTDVHVLHNGRSLFDDFVNVQGRGPRAAYRGTVDVKAGDTLDCVVGYGNGHYGADTTALALTLKGASGRTSDAAAEFSPAKNPAGPWSYGVLPPGPRPEAAKYRRFPTSNVVERVGGLCNAGSTAWEDLLDDQHPYQRVPHTAEVLRTLRTLGDEGPPLFVSEYGIGSAVDLVRATRHYERLGSTHAEHARFYRERLDRFLADWQRCQLAEVFGRPEDFFAASNRRMAGQRLLGLNALRANPAVIGHSLTGTVDQGMTGEGLWTTFREFKPGTADALADGWAPLRLCLFAEPVHAARGQKVRLEAVLANEDALPPGDYPLRLHVFGPDSRAVLERKAVVTIGKPGRPEPPFAVPVFAGETVIDGPPGAYRFVASFESGAAAAGGEAEFFVSDPAALLPVTAEVVLWGEDELLAKALAARGIRVQPWTAADPGRRQVILAGPRPPAPGGAATFRDLARRVARGSTVVFLAPEVFAHGGKPEALVPLARKGSLVTGSNWLYHADQWARPHPIFAGLPTGLLDYAYYRELIPDRTWVGLDPPAEAVAGAINASIDYSSGLLVAVYPMGAGRFVLNTLPLRENLGKHPAAERILRNLINDAARDLGQPPAALPADFDSHLKALGY